MNPLSLSLLTLALLALGLVLGVSGAGEPERVVALRHDLPDPAPSQETHAALATLEQRMGELERDLDRLDPPAPEPDAAPSVRASARATLRIQLDAVEQSAVAERLDAQRLHRLRELRLGLGALEEQRAVELLRAAEAELAALTRRMLDERTGHLPETHQEFEDTRRRWQERLVEALPAPAGQRIGEHFLPLR